MTTAACRAYLNDAQRLPEGVLEEVERAVHAIEQRMQLLILQLDTPGGLDSAMRDSMIGRRIRRILGPSSLRQAMNYSMEVSC